MNDPKTLLRDVEASVVPVGTKVTLQKGEQAYVTQSLGGSYTVVVNGTALVAAHHPCTRAALEQRGLRVVELDMSEFAKADGSLTCLSILLG